MLSSLFRLRTIDEQFLRHSEWARRLGSPTVVGLAGILSLPLGLFVIVPYSLTTLSGPSSLLALIISFVIVFFAGAHLVELSCAMPKNCVLYHFTFACLGELPAFIFAWLDLLAAVCLSSVLCNAWSQHMNILSGGALHPMSKIALEKEGWMTSSYFDVAALAAVLIAVSILCCSLNVVGTVSICLLIVCLLMVTSCSLVGFFHADPKNWLDAGFFTNGYQGVLQSCGAMVVMYAGVEGLSCLLEETSQPRKKLPIMIPSLITATSIFVFCVSTLYSMTTNVALLSSDTTVPDIFRVENVPSMKNNPLHSPGLLRIRYMLTVASVCGLSGAVLVSFLPGSRIIASLAQDRLIPIPRDDSTKTPLMAVLTFSTLTCIGIWLRRDVALQIICFIHVFKLLLTVILTHIQHFRPSPIGLTHEANHYSKVCQTYGNKYLSYGLDGSGTVSLSQSNNSLSSMSEDVALQMNVAKQEQKKLELRLERKMRKEFNEKSSLIGQVSIPRSVSQYRAIAAKSPSVSSFAAVNCGHNCVEESCGSPTNSGNSESPHRVHLYKRSNPDIPFVAHFNEHNKDLDGEHCNRSEVFVRSNWLLALFIILSLLFARLSNSFNEPLFSSISVLVAILVLMLIAFICVAKLPRNDFLCRRQARVPMFPYVTYVTILLLCQIISSSTIVTVFRIFILLLPGLFIYFAYGFRHSSERSSLCTLIIENPTAHDPDSELCRGIMEDNDI